MCADPRYTAAARSCCNLVEVRFPSLYSLLFYVAKMRYTSLLCNFIELLQTNRSEYNYKFEYHGERVKLDTIKTQCEADGGVVCDGSAMMAGKVLCFFLSIEESSSHTHPLLPPDTTDNPIVNIRPIYNFPYPSRNTFFWTDNNCTQKIKVRDDGFIAFIHNPNVNPFFADETVPYVDEVHTVSYISAPWRKDNMTQEEIYPSLNNTCGMGSCSITADDQCLCEVSLQERAVFSTLPSRDEVLSLKIGAFDPLTFTDSEVTYSLLESSADVEAYVTSDSGIIGSISTIFKVTDEWGDVAYLKNMQSDITLGIGEYILVLTL